MQKTQSLASVHWGGLKNVPRGLTRLLAALSTFLQGVQAEYMLPL